VTYELDLGGGPVVVVVGWRRRERREFGVEDDVVLGRAPR
jgi:hypothetical protein